MPLVVYNTLTRRKAPFEPVTPGKVGIYLCGPTVYKPSHVGHAVGPVIFDAVKRYLTHRGFDVTWVVNITDVEDKIIVEAAKQNTTAAELSARIEKDYFDAMAKLHVDGIDHTPRASEHIGGIIELTRTLIDRDYAYASGGDVYFDVSKDADYGKLSNRDVGEQQGQRDLRSGAKRNPGDFALWKAAKAEEPEEVKFDSPWGKGRPGWHIECSVMAMKLLGETFDIHGGGLDLVFPHHENEIAQSESASGKPFAKYWMHNGLTRINTKKISKSDTSAEMQAALSKMTLHNLLAAYPPELIRFLLLSTHYRRPIEYSDEELESKRKGLATFYRLFERIERVCGQSPYAAASDVRLSSPEPQASACAKSEAPPEPQASACAAVADSTLAAACDTCLTRFEQAMDDDFNTAAAIASLFELAPAVNKFIDYHKLGSADPTADRGTALAAAARLIAIGRLIGLFIDPPETKSADNDGLTDALMQLIIDVRKALRAKKDFETADLIRDRLADSKITIEDRPDGTRWRRG
jgi:cysteinyl-tRNA synthetase